MGVNSKIEWTHHTFNPWWGCARVSPGCEHCYAEALARRTGKARWGVHEPRMVTSPANWRLPLKWNAVAAAAGERHRVFCASMADVFEDREDLEEPRERLWELIRSTPSLDWLLLTKRPENLAKLLPWIGVEEPWPNAWLGTTVEDQRRAEERIPHLLRAPAVVRFLSCEPLLEQVDLTHLDADRAGDPEWCWINALTGRQTDMGRPCRDVPHVDWVIIGGESGHGARPFALEWARILVARCRAAGVAPFVKQLGAQPVVGGLVRRAAGIVNRKGGDWDEWPVDLRVREFPR